MHQEKSDRHFRGIKTMVLFSIMNLTFACGFAPIFGPHAPAVALIPRPVSLNLGGLAAVGIGHDILIVTDILFLPEARFLQEKLQLIGGFDIGIQTAGLANPSAETWTVISLENDSAGMELPQDIEANRAREAYRLRTNARLSGGIRNGIRIQATNNAGIFYGIQTLLQTVATAGTHDSQGNLRIPELEISDYPRFGWRGSMLDSSRHFISVNYIKRHLELMASLKLNVFHWHLTDDQGWRFPVPGLERLTDIGAWRPRAEPDGPQGRYGGFYTKPEIQDIVRFATERHIMIVPEVDMPGHGSAAIASYPGIACSGPNAPHLKAPLVEWGIFGNNLCPGKDATFGFVSQVIKELTELFPGPYIHFGGDEVHDIQSWETCPDCRARMDQLGFKEARQLERYFVSRVEQIIRDNDRIPVAWDDVVHSVSQTSTVLQFWTNETHLQEGRDIGFRFVLSPGSYTYLDMNYAEPEIRRWAGFISLERAYSLDPRTWNLEDNQVDGIEAPLWTEHIPDEATLDRQLWPRLSAIAETAWTPRQGHDWKDYSRRLAALAPLLERWGVKYYRTPEIDWNLPNN